MALKSVGIFWRFWAPKANLIGAGGGIMVLKLRVKSSLPPLDSQSERVKNSAIIPALLSFLAWKFGTYFFVFRLPVYTFPPKYKKSARHKYGHAVMTSMPCWGPFCLLFAYMLPVYNVYFCKPAIAGIQKSMVIKRNAKQELWTVKPALPLEGYSDPFRYLSDCARVKRRDLAQKSRVTSQLGNLSLIHSKICPLYELDNDSP
jgi:hypothetical protein